MTAHDKMPPRETFGFLMTRRAAVPVVETPSRWPVLLIGTMILLASGVAVLLIVTA